MTKLIIYNTYLNPEAFLQRCSVKKVFLEFHKIHSKTPVSEPLFNKVGPIFDLHPYIKCHSSTNVFQTSCY